MGSRNCLSCVRCYLHPGTPGWSEYTPSTPMSFYCGAQHWNFDQYDGMRVPGNTELQPHPKQAVASVFDFALTCKDYTPEEWAKEEPRV